MNETTIEKVQGENYCTVFSSEKKYIGQIKKYQEDYPNEVRIVKVNEDGSILAHIPSDWFRFIKPPTKRNYTDEQRKAMSERMKKAREEKK